MACLVDGVWHPEPGDPVMAPMESPAISWIGNGIESTLIPKQDLAPSGAKGIKTSDNTSGVQEANDFGRDPPASGLSADRS